MKTFLFLLCATFFAGPAFATEGADDIVGIWINHSGKGQIQIYRDGNKYFGKIIWLKEPNTPQGVPKTDSKNPNKSLQSRPILGAVILRDFTFHNNEWSGGYVYDPANGKEYRCFMKMKDNKTLSVRGYIGISLLGRTEEWTRMK